MQAFAGAGVDLVLLRAGEVAKQLADLCGEVLSGILLDAQGLTDAAREAHRAAKAHVDAARVQRLQHSELFGHHERPMVRQHHTTCADADPPRACSNRGSQHCGSGADHSGHAVVF